MIKHGSKPDWFIADHRVLTPIFGVPGIQMIRMVMDRFEVHRSHLALLEDDDAWRLLGETIPQEPWADRDAKTEPLGFKLRQAQHVAVDFIRARRGTLLGDEMRVGKTLSAAYSHDPSLGKLVIVAPLMVREVWLGWLRKIWPGEDIGVMIGRTFDPIEARKPIVFGHYDVLYHWQSGDRIGTLVLDEAHWLCNHRSRRTNAAIMLASRAERVVCSTGSPIWNMPPGLWSVLALIAPGAFGGYHDFCRRYAAPEPTAYGTKYTGISNGDELSKRLSEVMIRRRWADVQTDLPPITRNTVIVDLSAKERRQLDIEAEKLRQSPTTNTAAQLARYRDALSIVKLDAALAEAKSCLEAGEPVVIWTWHVRLADSLFEALIQSGFEAMVITGETLQHRRENTLELWRSSKNAALVVSISVGQVGIDLSHARRAIFAEIDYTPAMISQAEMRTFSPARAMNVSYIVADHFVDRKIIAALSRKLDAATPLDLGMGEGAISAIDRAFRGPEETPDLDRFMADLLAG
jgi:SWI/SNF-related matrix-associated actin-dependent regulator 1 of chromatin subfamily A